jgi:hypothetical protein
MLDRESEILLNCGQLWKFVKLPIHWDRDKKKLVIFPIFCKDLLMWHICYAIVGFGTFSSMYVSLSQVVHRDFTISPDTIALNILMVIFGSGTFFTGAIFIIYSSHTVFFWENLQLLKFAERIKSEYICHKCHNKDTLYCIAYEVLRNE